ncbi:MAG: hypothetical protein A2285_05005 [Elusimicrobia bacterium RIFOXYA12_FULL_57_11]|nr:MAG: hypothetical protein A2285_05005 [Elusimicrobia bacterium RIFOXYA12_FULL_57_11]
MIKDPVFPVQGFFTDARVRAVRAGYAAVLVWLITLVVFMPAAENGFVRWDDNLNFQAGADYRGPPLKQIKWALTSLEGGFYIPVFRLSHAFDYYLWGVSPAGHHFSSILLHACNAALVFFSLIAVFGRGKYANSPFLPAAAAFSALVFALHPLRVEAVAWASSRHNLLSMAFCLLTLLGYMRLRMAADLVSIRKWHILSGGLFAMALLSKPDGIMLPAALIILDLHLFGMAPVREKWTNIFRGKVHFFVMALPLAAVTIYGHKPSFPVYLLGDYGLLNRLAHASWSGVFYVWKTLLPSGLSPLYEMISKPLPWAWPYWFSIMSFSGLSALLIFLARRGYPCALYGWTAYLLLLAPVSGLFRFGYQLTADRYSYLACLPFVFLLTGGILRLGINKYLQLAAQIAVLAALSCFTRNQLQVWRNSESLWARVLAVDPVSSLGHANMGAVLMAGSRKDQVKIGAAAEHYRQALQVRPAAGYIRNNYCLALFYQGRLEEAAKQCLEAIRLLPDYPDAHNNLGLVLYGQGKAEQAAGHYREALRMVPYFTDAYNNLGTVLLSESRGDKAKIAEAAENFRQALRLNPSALAYYNYGNALSLLGLAEKAAGQYRGALLLSPAYAEAHSNLGSMLCVQGKINEAAGHYREALRLKPDYADAHFNLGLILQFKGKKVEAGGHFRETLRINPGYKPAQAALAELMYGP